MNTKLNKVVARLKEHAAGKGAILTQDQIAMCAVLLTYSNLDLRPKYKIAKGKMRFSFKRSQPASVDLTETTLPYETLLFWLDDAAHQEGLGDDVRPEYRDWVRKVRALKTPEAVAKEFPELQPLCSFITHRD